MSKSTFYWQDNTLKVSGLLRIYGTGEYKEKEDSRIENYGLLRNLISTVYISSVVILNLTLARNNIAVTPITPLILERLSCKDLA